MDDDAILIMFLVISDNAIRTFIFVCMNVAFHLQILSHLIATVLLPSAQMPPFGNGA
jgi:hypothetical protein